MFHPKPSTCYYDCASLPRTMNPQLPAVASRLCIGVYSVAASLPVAAVILRGCCREGGKLKYWTNRNVDKAGQPRENTSTSTAPRITTYSVDDVFRSLPKQGVLFISERQLWTLSSSSSFSSSSSGWLPFSKCRGDAASSLCAQLGYNKI